MNTLLWVIGVLILVILLPVFVGAFMVYIGWRYGGWWGWGSGVVLMTPFGFYWYLRLSQRIRNYLALLEDRTKPFSWDVEKSVDEFISLWKRQQEDMNSGEE